MPYADFQTLVTDLLRDDEGRITNVQRDSAIDLAVMRYSSDRPRLKKLDVLAAGGHTLAVPAGWDADFSTLIAVEYPIGRTPFNYIDRERIQVYQLPDGTQQLHFDDALPIGNVRVSFTIKQTLTAAPAADTVPIGDREAVCKWAAATLCDQLAALYSNTQDSTIAADTVQYQNKASERRKQAGNYRQQYFDALGINEKKASPAGVVTSLPLKDSLGYPRMYHGNRRFTH